VPAGTILMYEILLFTFHTLAAFGLGIWFRGIHGR